MPSQPAVSLELASRRSVRLGLLLALAACSAAPQAWSANFCVANTTQLRDVSSTINLLNDHADIRVRSGTFLTGGQRFDFRLRPGYSTTISGGWNSNCTVQTQDPGLTRLDADQAGTVMFVTDFTGAPSGSFALSNLTMMDGFTQSGDAGCLTIALESGSRSVIVDRTILRGCVNGFASGGGLDVRVLPNTTATVIVRNSLFTDNSASQGGGGGIGVTLENANSTVNLFNNTVVGNRATAFGQAGGISRDSTPATAGTLFLRNNVVVGNVTQSGNAQDIDLRVGTNTLSNNAYGVIVGTNFTASGSIVTNQPGFLAPGNYALRADSVLRNAGINLGTVAMGTHDLVFEQRIREGTVDIGAYEYDGLFRHGFE